MPFLSKLQSFDERRTRDVSLKVCYTDLSTTALCNSLGGWLQYSILVKHGQLFYVLRRYYGRHMTEEIQQNLAICLILLQGNISGHIRPNDINIAKPSPPKLAAT